MANYGGDEDDMDGMTFHDRLEFWGVEVQPHKKVDIVFGETDEELVHLTQARSAPENAYWLRLRLRRAGGAASAQQLSAACAVSFCTVAHKLVRVGAAGEPPR